MGTIDVKPQGNFIARMLSTCENIWAMQEHGPLIHQFPYTRRDLEWSRSVAKSPEVTFQSLFTSKFYPQSLAWPWLACFHLLSNPLLHNWACSCQVPVSLTCAKRRTRRNSSSHANAILRNLGYPQICWVVIILVQNYATMAIWRFPKMGVPLNHPLIHSTFHEIKHP